MKDFTNFLKIPYKKGGRDYHGCDCYGMAILVCKDYGLNLPDYNDSGIIGGIHGIADAPRLAKENGIVKLDKPKEGCFVRLKSPDGIENHCGVYLAPEMILHCADGIGTIIENMPNWRIIDYWGIQ